VTALHAAADRYRAAEAASKWRCPAGHLSWSPRKLDGCPHGGCDEKVECVAGPHRPKKDQEAK